MANCTFSCARVGDGERDKRRDVATEREGEVELKREVELDVKR